MYSYTEIKKKKYTFFLLTEPGAGRDPERKKAGHGVQRTLLEVLPSHRLPSFTVGFRTGTHLLWAFISVRAGRVRMQGRGACQLLSLLPLKGFLKMLLCWGR